LVDKIIIERSDKQLFNDLVLTKEGGAFITDTYAHRVYYATPEINKLELFLESDSLLAWANGIALSPDNSILYVASARHITVVDLQTKTMQPIENQKAIDNYGIDGLMYFNNSLVAIVNGTKEEKENHIARYILSPDGRGIETRVIIDKGNPLFNIPTTGVIVDNNLYCLANTCLKVFTKNQMNEKDKLQNPLVLKYGLAE
ncbi:MAG: hypothetical protein L0Y76_12570, partial [Ignavibacteria bacterium]|nr:hypothetical protein [Ignavibacteria bacterium]